MMMTSMMMMMTMMMMMISNYGITSRRLCCLSGIQVREARDHSREKHVARELCDSRNFQRDLILIHFGIRQPGAHDLTARKGKGITHQAWLLMSHAMLHVEHRAGIREC